MGVVLRAGPLGWGRAVVDEHGVNIVNIYRMIHVIALPRGGAGRGGGEDVKVGLGRCCGSGCSICDTGCRGEDAC